MRGVAAEHLDARSSDDAREAVNPDNLVCRTVRAVKQEVGDQLGVICDVALDRLSLSPASPSHPDPDLFFLDPPHGASLQATSPIALFFLPSYEAPP